MICIPVIIPHKSYGNFCDDVSEIEMLHLLIFSRKSFTYLLRFKNLDTIYREKYIVIDVMVFCYHFYPCDFKLPGRNALISALHFCLVIWINDNSITGIERSGRNVISLQRLTPLQAITFLPSLSMQEILHCHWCNGFSLSFLPLRFQITRQKCVDFCLAFLPANLNQWQ